MPLSSDRSIEEFLAFYPARIVRQVGILRRLVEGAVPEAVERLRPGWRLIGYDLPITRHGTYFAFVAPEPEHVHLGFEHGTLMADPDGILRGSHLNLRKVRYLTFLPKDRVPARKVTALVREAKRVASLSPSERQMLAASLAESAQEGG